MIAVVFDTNVVISGMLSPGSTPGKLLSAILDGLCQPVVTDSILAEYEDVMNRPRFRFSPPRIHALLDAISSRAVFAPFAPVIHAGTLPDPDDIIFLEAAFGLDVPIITGNAKHFPKRVARHLLIFSPAAFLTKLTEERVL
jgi:putative PIN family toxin of toxin-antitoxin system